MKRLLVFKCNFDLLQIHEMAFTNSISNDVSVTLSEFNASSPNAKLVTLSWCCFVLVTQLLACPGYLRFHGLCSLSQKLSVSSLFKIHKNQYPVSFMDFLNVMSDGSYWLIGFLKVRWAWKFKKSALFLLILFYPQFWNFKWFWGNCWVARKQLLYCTNVQWILKVYYAAPSLVRRQPD